MNILGITHLVSWNPAACLISDGKLIAFIEEERLIRLKHAAWEFPYRAIRYCLKKGMIAFEDVDAVAIGFENTNKLNGSAKWRQKLLDSELKSIFPKQFAQNKILYFDHHKSHIASAAIPSGFEQSNVISLDGWGGSSGGELAFFDKKEGIKTEFRVPSTNSWGVAYRYITEGLGFKGHSGEGKTMGLASYGKKTCQKTMPPDLFGFLGLPKNPNKISDIFKSKKLQGLKANPSCERSTVIAFTTQHYLETSLIDIAKVLYESSKCKNFTLAGGVALNCSANGKLAQQKFVKNIFIQPAAHDAGSALGAAILCYHDNEKKWPSCKFDHAYWGSKFSNEEIKYALKFLEVTNYKEIKNPSVYAGMLINGNMVVGWFQGSSEVGPRALGNRSILANPCDIKNLDKVNKIKGREYWRPLAPSILEENYYDIVDLKHKSPFMLMAGQVKKRWRSKIPAVVHVDNSCRPQSVCKKHNPLYWGLIQSFKERSGVPLVLNTSFNLSHEPIVNSPKDAIYTFLNSGLDALVIGKYCLFK